MLKSFPASQHSHENPSGFAKPSQYTRKRPWGTTGPWTHSQGPSPQYTPQGFATLSLYTLTDDRMLTGAGFNVQCLI